MSFGLMTYDSAIDRAAAGLLVLLTALVALSEWGVSVPPLARHLATLSVIVLLSLRVRVAQLAFVLAGIALTLWLIVSNADWQTITLAALDRAAFIAAFFTALATLRNVAATSPALRRAGGFLAAQPPGRRYAALSLGGHLFALLLNYGSILLLGSLATHAAQSEASPVIRRHRTRRMLLAIQRGFISSLPWSPLGFAMAISTALISGARLGVGGHTRTGLRADHRAQRMGDGQHLQAAPGSDSATQAGRRLLGAADAALRAAGAARHQRHHPAFRRRCPGGRRRDGRGAGNRGWLGRAAATGRRARGRTGAPRSRLPGPRSAGLSRRNHASGHGRLYRHGRRAGSAAPGSASRSRSFGPSHLGDPGPAGLDHSGGWANWA